jgi:Derlin-2/3
LILAFVYTYAQDNRGRKAMFYVIQIPVEFLPWAMLVMAFVSGGPSAVLSEAMGIVAAHLYDFLTRIYPAFGGGRNWITTPAFVRRYFGAGTPAHTSRAYGTAFRQPQPSSGSSSGGWSSSFQNPWSGRGSGRRLGGD